MLAEVGQGRWNPGGRTYRRTADLAAVWRSIRPERPSRPDDDPYVTLVQPSLPGMGT